jgi:hypothetical protein
VCFPNVLEGGRGVLLDLALFGSADKREIEWRPRAASGYLASASFLPKRRSKRATRPPVSMIFCLPV